MTQPASGITLPDRAHRTHAYLVLAKGTNAVRTSYERLAASFLCEDAGQDGTPCGRCVHCMKVQRGVHPDVRLYDAEKTTVDDIRALRDDTALPPIEGEKKVYVITHADSLDPKQQNAILKTLEEPPPYVTLILCAAAKSGILPTVLSRVSILAAGNTSFAQYLAAADGLMGKADEDTRLSLAAYMEAYALDDPSAVKAEDVTAAFALADRYFFGQEPGAVLAFPKEKKEEREKLATYCRVFMFRARCIMLYKLTHGRLPQYGVTDTFRKGCVRLSVRRAVMSLELFEKAYTDAENNGNVGAIYAYLVKHA